MVVSQILVEHGHFLRKLLIADKQAQKSSVPPKFEAICHILVEHDHFYFLMEHGHSSNFGGTQSFFKFWWNRDNFWESFWLRTSGSQKVFHQNLRYDHVPPDFEAICHILMEHGHIHFLMEHGPFSNFLAPVISLSLLTNMPARGWNAISVK